MMTVAVLNLDLDQVFKQEEFLETDFYCEIFVAK